MSADEKSPSPIGMPGHFAATFGGKSLACALPRDATAPFLTVVIRTTGNRRETLAETLASLVAQTCTDFEVLLVVHHPGDRGQAIIDDVRAQVPGPLIERTRILHCERPGRAAPLNDALAHLRGRYVAVLDDDDLALDNWVATFCTLAARHPLKLLRSVCYRQKWKIERDRGVQVATPIGPCEVAWPTTYDAVNHLHHNETPFMTVAFLIEVFHSLGLQFDEDLSTLEDWQLTTMAAMNYGVADTPEITAVYRWWVNAESSSFAHSRDEWSDNHRRVVAAFDRLPLLLPPGSASRICKLLEIEAAWKRRSRPSLAMRLLDKIRRIITRARWRLAAPSSRRP